MKTCSKCGEAKPLEEYHKRNDRPIGVQPLCKGCQKVRNANRKPGYNLVSQARRRASKKGATPELTTDQMKDISDIYDCARQLRELGYDVQVDHIDPLQGKKVCGLHVPENLTILPSSVNAAKGNRFTPYRVSQDNVITEL